MTAWGAYVHVPWCRIVCPYCAFAVVRDRPGAPYDAWAERIGAEWRQRAPSFPGQAATVYLGGGTPSRLPPAVIARVLNALPREPNAEVTAEVNPEDVDILPDLLAAGVNRVSLGLQTFHPRHLKRLTRPPPAAALARVAAAALRSWSADLMFGLPGQSLAELDADLDQLLAASPPHVSVYGLTLEEGTPFARAAARGRLRAADDDLWRAMYDRLVERLEGVGLQRYEVSNFARPGHESAHNRGYWTERPYVGLGPSAHGMAPDGSRWVNHRDLREWLGAKDATAAWEAPDPERQARDRLISGLRAREGVDLEALALRHGHRPNDRVVASLVKAALLRSDGGVVSLSGDGWPVADGVVRALVEGLEPAPRPAG